MRQKWSNLMKFMYVSDVHLGNKNRMRKTWSEKERRISGILLQK